MSEIFVCEWCQRGFKSKGARTTHERYRCTVKLSHPREEVAENVPIYEEKVSSKLVRSGKVKVKVIVTEPSEGLHRMEFRVDPIDVLTIRLNDMAV